MDLTDLCRELNNWFDKARVFGTFTVSNGSIDLDDLVEEGTIQNGQYFRIVGSVFNDGVYVYPTSELTDETFDGAIWAMAVPPRVIALSVEIDDWVKENRGALATPYQSENIDGYSYSKASWLTSDVAGVEGAWRKQFKSQLDKYRKIHPW